MDEQHRGNAVGNGTEDGTAKKKKKRRKRRLVGSLLDFDVMAFSSLARSLEEGSTIHSPPAIFFFLKWRLARAYNFHSLRDDQSTVAKRAEMTVTECSLRSCV